MENLEENLTGKAENVETGIVKWFSPKKGYGFIIRDSIPEGEANHEIFVHYSQVEIEGLRRYYPICV